MSKLHRKKSRPALFSPALFMVTGLSVILLLCLVVIAIKHTSLSQTCANSISCIKDLSGKYEPGATGFFQGKEIPVPPEIADNEHKQEVLGTTTNKHIFVDLDDQTLTAYEGDVKVFSFLISSGKWFPTPDGEFKVWIKLRYVRMVGGNKAIGTFYDLPNVPFTMYFYNDQYPKTLGYGLHGAYWHNNFGHPMSHGCVNISIPDAEKLYNWADVGTPISIFGTAPAS